MKRLATIPVIKRMENSVFMNKHGNKLILVLVLLFFSPFLLKQCKVQNRYGFIIATPEMEGIFFNRCEPMVVMSVDSGGAFYNAGIRAFDVIFDSIFSVTGFMRSLEKPSGTVLTIETIPDGFSAKDCDELWEMERVTRKVVAP